MPNDLKMRLVQHVFWYRIWRLKKSGRRNEAWEALGKTPTLRQVPCLCYCYHDLLVPQKLRKQTLVL